MNVITSLLAHDHQQRQVCRLCGKPGSLRPFVTSVSDTTKWILCDSHLISWLRLKSAASRRNWDVYKSRPHHL